MKCLVCGGRAYSNVDRLWKVLDAAVERLGLTSVIQGGARGADFLAWQWCDVRKIPCETFDADWKRHGDKAGPLRNQRMLDEGKPDFIIAFPTPGAENKGTNGMIKLARDAGLTVHRIDA